PPQVASDMVNMMTKVVEEGTARRAILDGIRAAGKTGTTNAYRDAWFVGYTGNFVCGVWFGNDDYKTMNQMTGGSLPAQTWHEIMAYAHQGVEIKPLAGFGGPRAPTTGRAPVAETKKDTVPEISPGRPSVLTKRGADVLVRVGRLMDDATRALAARGGEPAKPPGAQGAAQQGPEAFASASDQQAAGQGRGN